VKLTIMQWSWLIGTVIFFFAVLLDLVNIVNVPDRALIVVPIALFVVSWLVGPSFKELNEMNRSKRRG